MTGSLAGAAQRDQSSRRTWATKNNQANRLEKLTNWVSGAWDRLQNFGSAQSRAFRNLVDMDPTCVAKIDDLHLLRWSPNWREVLRDRVPAIAAGIMDSRAALNLDKVRVDFISLSSFH